MRSYRWLHCLALALTACTSPSSPQDEDDSPDPLFDRIVFTRAVSGLGPAAPVFGIWTARPDGSDIRVLRDSLFYPAQATVSPNGRSVVFQDADTLFVMRADGLNLRRLPSGTSLGAFPSWSPDGQWIYFAGQFLPGDPPQLYRVHPDGTNSEQLTHGPDATWSPTLSRDGRYLAYMRYRVDTPGTTWLVIRDLLLGGDRTVSDSSFTGRDGRWAPDNRSLLFLDANPTANEWAILRYDVDTRLYEFFLDSKGNRPATYSPDGRTLLYGAGELWLADSSGANPHAILADSAQNFEAYWTPSTP